jgi:Ca2+-transporting ATPase
MKNMVFMGTLVTRGKGQFIATSTGMGTEIGKIASMLAQNESETSTPLQVSLAQLGRWLVGLCLAATLFIVVSGIIRGEPVRKMFFTGITLAVAAIPEGLPAIVTVSLAIGVQRLAKRSAVIRRLGSVETLGCTTVICSDKTGTLTRNEMTVRTIVTGDEAYDISGSGVEVSGEFFRNGKRIVPTREANLLHILKLCVLCNDAQLKRNTNHRGIMGSLTGLLQKNQDSLNVQGDPTESALLVAAAKAGIFHESLTKEHKRITTIPFESERKMMSTVCTDPVQTYIVCTKGAPEVVMRRCSHIYLADRVVTFDRSMRSKMEKANEELGEQAYRVLAVAYKHSKTPYADATQRAEQNLVFVGLVGI